jgi:hypothetical protein
MCINEIQIIACSIQLVQISHKASTHPILKSLPLINSKNNEQYCSQNIKLHTKESKLQRNAYILSVTNI